jgi:hypothetical protein
MKRIFLFAFFALPYIAAAQSKLSYDLIFNVSGISNSTGKTKTNSVGRYFSPVFFDSAGTPVVLTTLSGVYTAAVPKTNPVKYKAKLTGGFSIGGKLNYLAYKKLGISIGVSVSYFKVVRSSIPTVESFSSPFGFTGSLLSSSGNWDSTRTYSPGTYTYSNGPETVEKFQFVTLNIPLSINYSFSKWQIEAGITSSFILGSKFAQETKKYSDPEISSAYSVPLNPYDPQPSPENETKHFFSVSVSPQYQLSNKLKIGIEYIHALSSVYSTNWYSKGIYPDMKTGSLGLKILYKLK